MADVTQYHVLFYGTPDGYQGNRAQIALYTGSQCIGYVRFHDAGMPFPADGPLANGQTGHAPALGYVRRGAGRAAQREAYHLLLHGRSLLPGDRRD